MLLKHSHYMRGQWTSLEAFLLARFITTARVLLFHALHETSCVRDGSLGGHRRRAREMLAAREAAAAGRVAAARQRQRQAISEHRRVMLDMVRTALRQSWLNA